MIFPDAFFQEKIPYALIYAVCAGKSINDFKILLTYLSKMNRYSFLRAVTERLLCPRFIESKKKRESDYGKRFNIIIPQDWSGRCGIDPAQMFQSIQQQKAREQIDYITIPEYKLFRTFNIKNN